MWYKARLPPSYFDASGTSNVMFDELAERPLMSPLAGMKHAYVRLAIVIFSHTFNRLLIDHLYLLKLKSRTIILISISINKSHSLVNSVKIRHQFADLPNFNITWSRNMLRQDRRPNFIIRKTSASWCKYNKRSSFPCIILLYISVSPKALSPDLTITTFYRNLSQHCWPGICKPRPNDRNISIQHIATLSCATCYPRLATLLRRVARHFGSCKSN